MEYKIITLPNGNKTTVKELQDSYKQFPGSSERWIDESGEPCLLHTTYQSLPCGCQVTGNGTLQFPLTVKQCEKHSK